MVFSVGGQLPESPSLTINNKAIEQASSAKFLGVYIDQTLNWECHIQARNQDFNEAKADPTTEMYFLFSDPFI